MGPDEVVSFYGDPKPYMMMDGSVDGEWESLILDYVYLPEPLPLGWNPLVKVPRVRVHRKLVGSLTNVFHRIRSAGKWDLLRTFDGTYCWRAKRTSPKLSLHCWGAAIDLNGFSNPLGGLGDMPWPIIDAFNQEGWEWGGEWKYADPMHFQAATGC